MDRRTFRILGFSALLGAQPLVADISSLVAVGEWYTPPNSKLETVKASPLPPGSFSAIMEAWSGGTYDTKRDRLIVWGGGHGDYSGNELYTFDVNTLAWSRASDPSMNVGGDERSGVYPDGKPRSQHTYDHIVYVPSIDRFCSLGAGGTYPGGQIGHNKTMCYDFDAKKWEQKANTMNSGTSAIADYDPVTQKVWMHGTLSDSYLASWDPVKDVWTKHVTKNGGLEYYYTAAIGRGKMLAIGRGEMIEWNLANPSAQPVKVATTGAKEIMSSQSPGFVFASKSGYYIAWAGGTALYAYNPDTKNWTKLAPASTNKVTPTAADPRGTYGRFQYIPSQDAVIGVNAVDEGVFISKLPTNLPAVGVLKDGRQGSNLRIELPYFAGRLEGSLAASDVQPVSLVLRTLDSRVIWSGSARNPGDGKLRLDSQQGLAALPSAAYFLQATSHDGGRLGGRLFKP